MGFLDKITDLKAGGSDVPEDLRERGDMYYRSEDFPAAAEWYGKAADKGDAEAQYSLGSMYDMGLGVPEDSAKAVSFYEKAAAQGHTEAAFCLGIAYMFGDIADPEKSFSWLNTAYERGQKDAAYFIGEALLNGNGTERDVDRALEFLREAAEIVHEYSEDPEDDYRAPLLLATTYDEGELVERDEDEAARWYELAADRDCDEAADRLVEMGRREKPKKGLLGRFRK